MCYAGDALTLPHVMLEGLSYLCWKVFTSCFSPWKVFFCFTLSARSLPGIFLFTLDGYRCCCFSVLSRACSSVSERRSPPCSIVRGPHAVCDGSSSAGVSWGASQVVLVVIDCALWSGLSAHTHVRMREKSGTDTGMGLFRKTAFQMSPFSLSFISQSRTFYFSLQQSGYIWRTTRWMLFKGLN